MYKAITLIIISSLLATAGCAPKHNNNSAQKAQSPTSPSAPAPSDGPSEVKTQTTQQHAQDPNSPPPSIDTSRPTASTAPQAPAVKQTAPAPSTSATTSNTAPATQQSTNPTTPAAPPAPMAPAPKPLPQAPQIAAPTAPIAPQAPQAPVQNSMASWRFSDLRVLRPDTLTGAMKGSVNVIYDNSLQTQERALFKIFDIGSGILCSTVISGTLDKGDFLSFEKTDTQPWDQDKTVTIVGIGFRNSNGSKKLRFECSARGDVTQADFLKNMDTIVDFKDGQGNFPEAPEDQTSEKTRAIETKTKSFKIIDLNKFSKTDVNAMGENKVMSLASGELISSTQAQQLIEINKVQEACQIGLVKGKLQTNTVYNWDDTFDMGADHNRGYGMLRYVYKADEQNSIQLICIMRLTARSEIIFDTFKGVLEFGAK